MSDQVVSPVASETVDAPGTTSAGAAPAVAPVPVPPAFAVSLVWKEDSSKNDRFFVPDPEYLACVFFRFFDFSIFRFFDLFLTQKLTVITFF